MTAQTTAQGQTVKSVLVEADQSMTGIKGQTTVNVRVPMQLLRAGVRLASLIPAQAHQHFDEALNRLTKLDARQGRVVELRFFGGLSVEETAEFLSISPKTVKRDWSVAKAWLHAEVRGGSGIEAKATGAFEGPLRS